MHQQVVQDKKYIYTFRSCRNPKQRIMTKIGLGNGFPTQPQSKSQYTEPSPGFPFGITPKYAWGSQPAEMAWQQIVRNAIKHTQQFMWKGSRARDKSEQKGFRSVIWDILSSKSLCRTPILSVSTKVEHIKAVTRVKMFSLIKEIFAWWNPAFPHQLWGNEELQINLLFCFKFDITLLVWAFKTLCRKRVRDSQKGASCK